MASNVIEVDPVSSKLRVSDDILFLLAKHFLNHTDCLALALSGSAESFPAILGRRINLKKKLSISLCYFITVIPWKSFFQQHIQSLSITTFDGSHCYWLSPEELCSMITQMINLEELIINDTKISLAHFNNIFSVCQKVVKLSFSLTEKNLNQYQENVREKASFDVMVLGFHKLTHVKIFTLAPSDYSFHCWPVIFGVLKWCCRCIDLQLEVAYSNRSHLFGLDPSAIEEDMRNEFERVLATVRSDLFPQLGWMSSLQSLIFIFSYQHLPLLDSFLIQTFIKWLLYDRRPELGRLWIPRLRHRDSIMTYLQLLPESSTRLMSVRLELDNNLEVLNDSIIQQLRHLEHLGGNIYFSRLDLAPDLKYVQASCSNNNQGLNEFCQSHPMIEDLHFDTRGVRDSGTSSLTNSVWDLPKLKTVVYRCDSPVEGVLDNLIKFGHMIEALHLDGTWDFEYCPMEKFKFLSAIRFQHLHSLSLNGIQLGDGSCLLPIVKQCPKLERLHISCTSGTYSFLPKLGECLPLTTKLRDFRLKTRIFEIDSTIEDFLENLLKCSSHLKRLVLDDQCGYNLVASANNPTYDIGDCLFNFVSKMELLAFSFTSVRVHPDVFKELSRRFIESIVPLRPPSFWFHLGSQPPNANDHLVPRIHSDEIVHHIDWFHASPKFDWYCPAGNL